QTGQGTGSSQSPSPAVTGPDVSTGSSASITSVASCCVPSGSYFWTGSGGSNVTVTGGPSGSAPALRSCSTVAVRRSPSGPINVKCTVSTSESFSGSPRCGISIVLITPSIGIVNCSVSLPPGVQ